MDTSDQVRTNIARQRALGMSDETISLRLSLEGWSQTDIVGFLKKGAGAAPPKLLPRHVPPDPLQPELATVVQTLLPEKKVPKAISAVPTIPSSRRLAIQTVLVTTAVCVALGASVYAVFLRTPVVYSISLQDETSTSTPITYGALPALADPGYYQRVKERFIASDASFIDADLSAMQLTVYTHGTSTLVVPILAKGKPGSWWETPVGIYKIQTKEQSHFSSLGHVFMPYSLDFDGNFFIHGWPYYEDGTPVATSYSGGCIRLSTDDAGKVFAYTDVGMPVLVYKTASVSDSFQYTPQGPKTIANEYLVADIRNGTVLLNSGEHSVVPIASITKLITALVVIENENLDKIITVTPEMIEKTTIQRLHPGMEVSVHDMLILMLTESSNEAAEAFAVAFGHDRFMDLMNKKAISIGMVHTSFGDPSGLSPDNISSAADLFTLLKYIYENRKFVFDITSNSLEHDAYGVPVFKGLENFNFIRGATNQFVGGKIGNTDAAMETYAGVFGFKVGTEVRPIAVIALGSQDVQTDVASLLRYVNATYAHSQ